MNILELAPNLGTARGTSEYPSSAWPQAQYIDWGGEDNHIASVVFNRETGHCYCVEIFTGTEALRYLAPESADEWLQEQQALNIDTEDSGQGPWRDIDPNTVLLLLRTLGEQRDTA